MNQRGRVAKRDFDLTVYFFSTFFWLFFELCQWHKQFIKLENVVQFLFCDGFSVVTDFIDFSDNSDISHFHLISLADETTLRRRIMRVRLRFQVVYCWSWTKTLFKCSKWISWKSDTERVGKFWFSSLFCLTICERVWKVIVSWHKAYEIFSLKNFLIQIFFHGERISFMALRARRCILTCETKLKFSEMKNYSNFSHFQVVS